LINFDVFCLDFTKQHSILISLVVISTSGITNLSCRNLAGISRNITAIITKGNVLIQLGDWGWDDDLTGALGGLTDEFFLEGGWDARAALEPSLGSGLVQHKG